MVCEVGAEEACSKEELFPECVGCLLKDRGMTYLLMFPANSTDGCIVGLQETISASDTVAEAPIP